MSFVAIVDTKEKNPWNIAGKNVIDVKYESLKTGDYSIEGYEDVFCIERKGSLNEIANNISQARFKRELERISEFKYAYLILEDTLENAYNYPASVDLPAKIKKTIRINGNYLVRCLNRMQVKYGFNIIYAGNRQNAQRVALNLMEDVAEQLNA